MIKKHAHAWYTGILAGKTPTHTRINEKCIASSVHHLPPSKVTSEIILRCASLCFSAPGSCSVTADVGEGQSFCRLIQQLFPVYLELSIVLKLSVNILYSGLVF